jgi:hypothetical protein
MKEQNTAKDVLKDVPEYRPLALYCVLAEPKIMMCPNIGHTTRGTTTIPPSKLNE